MFCKICGGEISDDAVYCIHCGGTIKSETKQTIPQVESTDIKKDSKTLKTMLSIILSVIIFLAGLLSVTIITARESLSDDVVENVCSDIDAEVIAKDSSFASLVQKIALRRINTNEKRLERFLEKSTFFDAVENIADEYADYLLKGKKPDGIKNADVVNFVRENGDVISQELEYEDVVGDYHKYYDIDNEKTFGFLAEDADIPVGLEIAKNVMSKTTVWILIAVVVILAVLLFIIRNRKLDTFMWLGVTICLVAFVFGISCIVGNIFIGFVGNDLTKEVFSVYADNLEGLVLKNVVILAIFGAVCIVIKSLLKKQKK